MAYASASAVEGMRKQLFQRRPDVVGILGVPLSTKTV